MENIKQQQLFNIPIFYFLFKILNFPSHKRQIQNLHVISNKLSNICNSKKWQK